MDIMNILDPQRYEEVDDLLAFISIYDDEQRTKVFNDLLESHKADIQGKVCVELGCGLGFLSEKMAQLGAKRVYAIERNPYLFQLARKRLRHYKNVIVVLSDAREFEPPEPVDVLVHEFYGQMLFDEDLFVLEELSYQPKLVLPDGGNLLAGTVDVEDFEDEVVDSEMIRYLDGVLVSGLFDEEGCELRKRVAHWSYGKRFNREYTVDIAELEGDLLYFGVEIEHSGQTLCQAGICSNWSYVWTYRTGDRFMIRFVPADRGFDIEFKWV